MDQNTPPSAPARRARRTGRWIVLVGLGVPGAAVAVYVLRMFVVSVPMVMRGGLHAWLFTFNGVMLAMVATLPLSVLVVWLLARRRRAAGTEPAWARHRSLAEVGLVHGTVPWVWLILMPGARAGEVPGRLSLVPVVDLLTMGPLGILGNLLVFAALGFFAPMRFTALASVPRILVLGAGCSVLAETLQYVLRLDRVSSVDDVLVNATGAALAALASRRWWRAPAAAPTGEPRPGRTPTPAGGPAPCVRPPRPAGQHVPGPGGPPSGHRVPRRP
ncbi:VanZ family protein [Streptomyces sp. AC627_RSS907]|uniref:VanZ family protein n=1 Tax=Streptomyces sp. AC627_RSS907 TaxID=2823684 RepID=UPI001C214510|nr:VanZ family protein [Streptomyces sp. AC627_RSS907]